MNTSDYARVIIEGKEYNIPYVVGTEKEKALDIRNLRTESGFVTLDYGFGNTASVKSEITYLNGEEGILRYRGYSIEDLTKNATFLEVAYLLIYGNLPDSGQIQAFENEIKEHTMINEEFKRYYDVWPHTAHPMGLLTAAVGGMVAFYNDSLDPMNPEHIDICTVRLLAKLPTIIAQIYKKKLGQPFMYPQDRLSYTKNLLHMMYAVPTRPYEIDPDIDAALNKLLILHADHEQNCSTSTVRMIGSSRVNLFASISGGISALWGSLHGGANQAVLEMLMAIKNDGGNVKKYIEKAKDPKDPFRLMGFGHRVYKNYDPRSKLIKSSYLVVLEKLGKHDPLLEIAQEIEHIALKDDYFIERKLYPNVDFYSGLMYKAMKIPVEMFTVMFALGRLPGWIAHWREMSLSKENRINRPRQIYTGQNKRPYVALEQRGDNIRTCKGARALNDRGFNKSYAVDTYQ